MIVEPGFLDHWKTQALIQATEDPASPLMLIRLWEHCQHRKTNRFPNLPDCGLAAICRWSKQPEQLKAILVECGFVRIENNVLIVHDWDDANKHLIGAWVNGAKGGRPRKLQKKKSPPKTDRLTDRVTDPSIYLSNTANKGRGTEVEVLAYGETIGVSKTEAQGFFDAMEAGGWTRAGKSLKDWKAHFRNYKRFGWLMSSGRNGQNRSMSAFEIKNRQEAITDEINKIWKKNGGKRVEGDRIDELKQRRTELQQQLTI